MLRTLCCAVQGLDVDDMRAHAQYAGGYHEEHPVIKVLGWYCIAGGKLAGRRQAQQCAGTKAPLAARTQHI